MQFAILAAILAIAVIIVFYSRGRTQYYKKIFSDEHYVEIGNWLRSMLELGPVTEPNFDDGTFLQSLAGCGFTYSRDIGEKDVIHIAISQVGDVTTHAVCSRLAYLILVILNRNEAVADAYYTESHVHHILLARDTEGQWLTNSNEFALAEMQACRPVPFRYEPMQER